VNTVLQALAAKGLVGLKYGSVEVLDLQSLRRALEDET
jgi:hypothetical protein